MKNNDRITLKYDWLEVMKNIEAEECQALLSALYDYSKSGIEFPEFSTKSKMLCDTVIKEFKKSTLMKKCGALGGNPFLKKQKEAREKTEIDPSLFEIFWGEYPKRVGKTYARQCFYRLKPTRETVEKMVMAIKEQKKSEQWKSENGKFIPNPATWLNQGRWMDEVRGDEGNEFKEMKIGISL